MHYVLKSSSSVVCAVNIHQLGSLSLFVPRWLHLRLKFNWMHKMPIFSYGYLAKTHCLHGMPTFTLGTPILIVSACMGCPFSQQDAHVYCENGHPECKHREALYFHVKIGFRDACIWGCLYLLDTGVPISLWYGPRTYHGEPISRLHR